MGTGQIPLPCRLSVHWNGRTCPRLARQVPTHCKLEQGRKKESRVRLAAAIVVGFGLFLFRSASAFSSPEVIPISNDQLTEREP